jgi:hypothetical protein
LHVAYVSAGHPEADGVVMEKLHAQAARCGLDVKRLVEDAVAIARVLGQGGGAVTQARAQVGGPLDERSPARLAERLEAPASAAMPNAAGGRSPAEDERPIAPKP